MALDDLQAVIESLRVKVESHRAHLSENETRTRQVLIDPLLKELGWDVSDPDQVELEYSAGTGREKADYVLMSQGKPVAVIEAKRLGYRLDQSETMQVLNYANSRGIAHMAVTNGDEWRMYDVFSQKPIEERVIMEFSITRTPAHESALQSLRIWNPNLSSARGPVGASESIVKAASTPESLTRPRVETAYSDESSSPQLGHRDDQSQGRVHSDHGADLKEAGWIPLSELDRKHSPSNPELMMFEDGTETTPKNRLGIMLQIANWLADKTEKEDMLKFSRGKVDPIYDSTDAPPRARPLANGLYMDVYGISAWRNILRVSNKLLAHCGYDASKVYVKFD